MQRLALGLVASLSVATLTLVLWRPWATGERTLDPGAQAPAPARAATPAPRAPEPTTPAPAAPAAPVLAPAEPSTEAAAETLAAGGERRSAQRTVELEGQVVWPPDLPADEVATVEAFGERPPPAAARGDHPERQQPLASAPVAADGRFRLEVPEEGATVWVSVRGRYLCATDPERVAVADAEPVLLRPRLGAWIRGRLVPPPGSDPAWLTDLGEDVELRFDRTAVMGPMGPRGDTGLDDRHTATAAESGFVFEFCGVVPAVAHDLWVLPEQLAAAQGDRLQLAAGERRDVELRLVRGGTVRGRVVDGDGQPVSGARLEVRRGSLMFGQGGVEVRSTTSDGSGHFELRAVAPGRSSLEVEADGHLATNLPLELVDGQVLEGQEVQLHSGATIGGRVEWPDGRPAAELEVRVSFDLSFAGGAEAFNAMRGAEGQGRTDADGEFSVGALGQGPFTVRAEARAEGAAEESSAEQGPAGRWLARADAVRPGTADLVLVLQPPVGIGGTVVDDTGQPVTEFTVLARTKTRGMLNGLGAETQSGTFEDEQGLFFLDGLRAGGWELLPQAEGYAPAEFVSVELPGASGESLQLVLPRASLVRGRVFDHQGVPRPGASVSLAFTMADLSRVGIPGEQRPTATCDEEGAYELTGLGAGLRTLVARAEGFAASEALPVELPAAGAIEGIDLHLRRGGSNRGTLLDEAGEPWAGQSVLAQLTSNPMEQQWQSTDGSGEFLFGELTPGAYQVMCFPADGGTPGGEEGLGALIADLRLVFTEVRDGEESEVTLGARPADPVRILGRVVAGDEPVSGAMVTFLRDGSGGLDQLGFSSTDAEGKFTLELAEPGRYLLSVQQVEATGQQQSVEFQREVPAGEEHELLLELPVGGIAGVVLGPDGKPVAGARVSLAVDGPIQNGSVTGGNYAEVSAGPDGRYELRWLRPGNYSVAAGGALFGGLFGDAGGQTFGRQVRRGLVVGEGQWLRGVDFRLRTPGRIEGRVVGASGEAVTGAAIFLRDEDGNTIDRISMVATDATGRFEYTGLEEGLYQVSARTAALVSPEPQGVRVTAGEASTVTLTLDQGTVLVVGLSDGDGNSVRCSLVVTDPNGQQVNGLWSMTDLMSVFSGGGISSDEQRVGPLAPGKYRLEATSEDGRSAKKSVTLEGQGERRIRLRLD